VLFALRSLVSRVVDDLAAAAKRTGRLLLILECENRDVSELVNRAAPPTAVPSTLFNLLRARLEWITLDGLVIGSRRLAAELLEDGGRFRALAGSDPTRYARHRARSGV
jgi:hypothetical protein